MKKKIEDQLEILKAYVDGKQIVWRPMGYGDEMVDLPYEMLKADGGFDFKGKEYAVSEGRPHSVNWNELSERVIAVATNKDGKTFFFRVVDWEKKYTLQTSFDSWDYENLETFPAHVLTSFFPGTMPWNKSAVIRPSGA